MDKKYYFFELEIALKKEDDSKIYAFENISHIPTHKLIEIFGVNLDQDPHLVEGYVLTNENYLKNKNYIEENIGPINLEIFEYCLRQYVSDNFNSVRKLYKEDLFE